MEIGEFRPVDLADVYGDLALREAPETRPYTVLNMISSLDGKATIAGRVGGLGSGIDRLLMRKLRAACHALAYGVGTLRAENVDPRVPADLADWRQQCGMSAQPLRVVFSASGGLPLDNLFFRVPGDQPVIFTTRRAGAATITRLRGHSRVFVSGGDQVDLRQAMTTLAAAFGVRRLVAEGGPMLNHALFKAGLVDELFLTIAPKVVAGTNAKTIAEGPALPDIHHWDLVSVHRAAGELFLRYRAPAHQEHVQKPGP